MIDVDCGGPRPRYSDGLCRSSLEQGRQQTHPDVSKEPCLPPANPTCLALDASEEEREVGDSKRGVRVSWGDGWGRGTGDRSCGRSAGKERGALAKAWGRTCHARDVDDAPLSDSDEVSGDSFVSQSRAAAPPRYANASLDDSLDEDLRAGEPAAAVCGGGPRFEGLQNLSEDHFSKYLRGSRGEGLEGDTGRAARDQIMASAGSENEVRRSWRQQQQEHFLRAAGSCQATDGGAADGGGDQMTQAPWIKVRIVRVCACTCVCSPDPRVGMTRSCRE